MRTISLTFCISASLFWAVDREKKIVFFHIIVSHKIQTVHCIFEYEYFGITKTAMFHSGLLEWPEAQWCESLKKWNFVLLWCTSCAICYIGPDCLQTSSPCEIIFTLNFALWGTLQETQHCRDAAPYEINGSRGISCFVRESMCCKDT